MKSICLWANMKSDLLSFCKMEGNSLACPHYSDLSKRTRPDLLTCVRVLCGRVLILTVTDIALLTRVLKYLSGTVGYGLRFNKVIELSDGPFSPRTRHLSIKLFFAKQNFDLKDIVIRFCRSESMLADMLTKALVGAKFRLLSS